MVGTKRTLVILGLLLLGSCGFTQHQVVKNGCTLSPGGRRMGCQANCPAGKKVTGGGWSVDEVVVTLEAPFINRGRVVTDAPTDPPESWVVEFEPHPRATGRLLVWAICANVGN